MQEIIEAYVHQDSARAETCEKFHAIGAAYVTESHRLTI